MWEFEIHSDGWLDGRRGRALIKGGGCRGDGGRLGGGSLAGVGEGEGLEGGGAASGAWAEGKLEGGGVMKREEMSTGGGEDEAGRTRRRGRGGDGWGGLGGGGGGWSAGRCHAGCCCPGGDACPLLLSEVLLGLEVVQLPNGALEPLWSDASVTFVCTHALKKSKAQSDYK